MFDPFSSLGKIITKTISSGENLNQAIEIDGNWIEDNVLNYMPTQEELTNEHLPHLLQHL